MLHAGHRFFCGISKRFLSHRREPGVGKPWTPTDVRAMETLRLTTPIAGYDVFEIRHPLCSARIARHGAHVMEWAPAGATPVLYHSPAAIVSEGKAIRGGIPVCWPWFNAHPSDPGKPSHGFVRNRFWNFEGSDESDQGVTLKFSLEDDAATLELWPYRFQFGLEVRCGRVLEVHLTTRNRSDEAIAVSGALHTYLAVGDVNRVSVEGVEGREFTETVGGRFECPPSGEPLRFSGETDRIYHHGGAVTLLDPSVGRRVVVEKEGSPSTVIWNPGSEKGAAIGDLPADGFKRFVCVEAAIANERRAIVPPDGDHLLSTWISVTPL